MSGLSASENKNDLFLDETYSVAAKAKANRNDDTLTSQADDKTFSKRFDEFHNEATLNEKPASFGDVVGIKRPSSAAAPVAVATNTTTTLFSSDSEMASFPFVTSPAIQKEKALAAKQKTKNISVAILSIVLAISGYVWQYMHPLQPIQLLAEMQSKSEALTVIGRNGKPTLVDFWAPWCEECQRMAPTLHALEQEYNGRVNFVMVDGDLQTSWTAIEQFGVDAIPHMALVSATGEVETALIGPVPIKLLQQDLDVLLHNAQVAVPTSKVQQPQELPFKMIDMFASKASRQVYFDSEE